MGQAACVSGEYQLGYCKVRVDLLAHSMFWNPFLDSANDGAGPGLLPFWSQGSLTDQGARAG